MTDLDIAEVAQRAGADGRVLARRDRAHGRAGRPPRIDRSMPAGKAEELDRRIRELGVLRDSLRHAAACPAPSHIECPTFRGLLDAAASRGVPTPGKRMPGG
ncbi:MerR family transcriptional regulator [Streptomyces violarus]|uniref:hypothetical protein n=1 Tax=Streptomyces violarus TaxID=67380 RepID=UPI0021BEFD64|nr:hypothetical protein [Streptomyces violarus]MCT9140305.1 hypothetical protein [Streptomyces violarus]